MSTEVAPSQRKMKVLFIDDDETVGYVDEIMNTLDKTGLVECEFLGHYDECGTTRNEVQSFVRGFDILVLDVLEGIS